MRALILALALLLSSCASMLTTQAEAVVDVRAVANDLGRSLNADARAEWEAAGAAQRVSLQQRIETLMQEYEAMQHALDTWADLVRTANEHSSMKPIAAAATKLVSLWTRLAVEASGYGITLPPPPASLTKLAE